jgi:hypothetical protein
VPAVGEKVEDKITAARIRLGEDSIEALTSKLQAIDCTITITPAKLDPSDYKQGDPQNDTTVKPKKPASIVDVFSI